MDTLIANGTIVTANETFTANVLVRDDRIAAITAERPQAARVVDATARLILPGGIDVHTHLDMPHGRFTTADDFESGTIAAVCGGTTTVVDFAPQAEGKSLSESVELWSKRAEGRAVADYGFHAMITEVTGSTSAQMRELVQAGIPSVKVFMAYPGRLMLDDRAIFKVLRFAAEHGALVMIHAENGLVIEELIASALAEGRGAPKYHAATRPPIAESEAVQRAISLARLAGASIYFVHVSTGRAVRAIGEARQDGQPVFAETCPQYLLLCDDTYEQSPDEAAKYVMSPPLRRAEEHVPLWDGLARGDLQVVSTDHCPFLLRDKQASPGDFTKIPNGAPGIETRLSLLYDAGVRTGRLTLSRLVDAVSTVPAKLFGLYPRKGAIEVGSDADIVIFDPERETVLSAATHRSRADYCLYEGRRVTGVADTVLVRGQVVVEDRTFVGSKGSGRRLRRLCN